MSKTRKQSKPGIESRPADLAALLQRLNEHDAECVHAAAKALHANEGGLTPSENFIHQLLMLYWHHQRLMPSEVRSLLEDFEQELLNMAQGARTVLRFYPGVFLAENVEAVRVAK